jgi:hypothetical protein
VRAHFDALDRLALHGTLWDYSATRDDWNRESFSIVGPGGQETPVAREAVRAFPRAVAGALVAFHYDADARRGALTWRPKPVA